MKSDSERLLDIQESIERIEKYVVRGECAFMEDELIQSWMVRHLQIIGEAAARLSEKMRLQHAEMPWNKIIGMRNILVHDYFAIDKQIIWEAVVRDLPLLKDKVELLLKETR
jgi:uncharacterized protein with HEPN domain